MLVEGHHGVRRLVRIDPDHHSQISAPPSLLTGYREMMQSLLDTADVRLSTDAFVFSHYPDGMAQGVTQIRSEAS